MNGDNYTFKVHTFGCKVNTYDSGLLQKRLSAARLVLDERKPRVHILNTCAVTAQATRDAQKLARRLKASDPLSTVVVTGCAAQVDTEKFADMPGIDLVVANSHKGELENLLRRHFSPEPTPKVYKSNIFRKLDLEAGGGIEAGHTRSFLKIQDGCNSFCTYCVIPFGRGRSRSIQVEDLVRRANELYHLGSREIVLTGVHIGDYEDGHGRKLEDLVEAVLLKTKFSRIRLTSLEPVELTPKLFELYQDQRMCRHFHMSIQSATTSVLKGMRRNYGADEVEWSLNAVAHRVPGSFVGMDVIVGFPGETAADFDETCERLQALPWTRIHVFPYSERPGTKAEKLDDKIPPHEIKRRAKVLRKISTERFNQMAENQVGSVKSVLRLESPKGAEIRTLSEDYWPVVLAEASVPENGIFSVKIKGLQMGRGGLAEQTLLGELV